MATPLPPQRGLPSSVPDVARVLDQFRAAAFIGHMVDLLGLGLAEDAEAVVECETLEPHAAPPSVGAVR